MKKLPQSNLLKIKWSNEFEFVWDLKYSRNLNDWEVDDFAALLGRIHSVKLDRSLEDYRVWKGDSSGVFSCKSFFHNLTISNSSQFPQYNVIWKGGIPTKVKVFTWLASLGKVNTCDMVQKRRPFMALSPSWCCLCKEASESIDHILLHCKFTAEIWNRILRLFNCVGAMIEKWADFISIRRSFMKKNKKIKMLWRLATIALAWQVWLERNRRIFDDKCSSDEDVWDRIKFVIGLWARAANILDQTENFLFSLDCFGFLYASF